MQIMLNQDEIEEAIRNHVLSQLAIRENQEVSMDLRAGRGENGFTATLDVRPRTGETNRPKPAFSGIRTSVNVEAPSKSDKTGISTRKVEKASDAKAVGGTAEAPETEEPQKPAASRAPKKGIFATVPKAAAEAAPEPTEETDTAAEPAVPDQETPVREEARQATEELAREDTRDGSEAPAGQPAEQPGARKSIFTFAPKKSAG